MSLKMSLAANVFRVLRVGGPDGESQSFYKTLRRLSLPIGGGPIPGECPGSGYFFNPDIQFSTTVISAELAVSTVLIRNLPSGATSYGA